jgi:hypothetical protein
MKPLRQEDVLALVRAGALLLIAGTLLRSLDWVFSSRPILAVVIGAFFLDLWAQKIGARWMAGGASSRSLSTFFTWAGVGLGLGLFVVVVTAAFGAAHLSMSRVSAESFALGVLRTAAYAFRDELLFRGVPLALVGGHLDRRWSIAFSVALAVAPLVLMTGTIAPIALTAASGAFYALIWSAGSGGFAAWATHTGWRIAIEVIAGGSIIEVAYEKGALPSAQGALGLPAYVAALAFVLSAFVLYRRTK